MRFRCFDCTHHHAVLYHIKLCNLHLMFASPLRIWKKMSQSPSHHAASMRAREMRWDFPLRTFFMCTRGRKKSKKSGIIKKIIECTTRRVVWGKLCFVFILLLKLMHEFPQFFISFFTLLLCTLSVYRREKDVENTLEESQRQWAMSPTPPSPSLCCCSDDGMKISSCIRSFAKKMMKKKQGNGISNFKIGVALHK